MYIPKLSPPNGRYNTNILPLAVVSPAEQQDQHDNMINTGPNIRQNRCHKRFAHSAHPSFKSFCPVYQLLMPLATVTPAYVKSMSIIEWSILLREVFYYTDKS